MIAFILEASYYLDIFSCDIVNAYLNAKCRDKLWKVAGKYSVTENGILILIARELYLYGIKSSGSA